MNTGREIIVGDFCSVPLNVEPTVIIGNPPFELGVIDKILARSHSMLQDGGRVGFILPAYAFQTAARVSGYADNWSISQEMIPRNIYEGLSKPLIFALFLKDKRRKLFGFALYHEAADVQKLPKDYRDCITSGGGSVWLNVLKLVINRLGGKADLQAIYTELEGKRPTQTKFWREQIRKVLRQHVDVFTAQGDGMYSLLAHV
jgi:site-specific DNA-methyltransferase (adenine-specific)